MVTASDLLQLLLEKEEPEPQLPGDEPKAGDSTSSASQGASHSGASQSGSGKSALIVALIQVSCPFTK